MIQCKVAQYCMTSYDNYTNMMPCDNKNFHEFDLESVVFNGGSLGHPREFLWIPCFQVPECICSSATSPNPRGLILSQFIPLLPAVRSC